jgi:hypothetical protein
MNLKVPMTYEEDGVAMEICVSPDGKELHYYATGKGGITKIVAYPEAGGDGYALWFAVYDEDGILYRVNGKFVVEVRY